MVGSNIHRTQSTKLILSLYAVSVLFLLGIVVSLFVLTPNGTNYTPKLIFGKAARLAYILNTTRFVENNRWIFNNNIMQYSAYVIVKNDIAVKIESMIYIAVDAPIEQLRCLIASIDTSRVYTLNATYVFRTSQADVRKIVCLFDEELKISDDNRLGVAVVVVGDYTEETIMSNHEQYPFSLITYHRPYYLDIHEPRVPNVAVCLQYVSIVYAGIVDWLKLHRGFQVARLIMYDGSPDGALRRLLGTQFEDFVTIYENYIKSPICDTPVSEFSDVVSSYLRKCGRIQTAFFNNNEKRNQMSSNDCYTQFSYKYEFVTLYDLDELTIPRYYDAATLATFDDYSCSDKTRVCNLQPLTNMHSYLRRLVNDSFPHPISKLRSIEFPHAAYFIPDNVQVSLMEKIKAVADKLRTANETFPIKISIFPHGETFVIEEADKDYVTLLIKAYDAFMCYYESHLKHIEGFNKNMIRFLYYIPFVGKRFHKSIFYTQNVYAVFTHDPIFFDTQSIILRAPWTDGHVNVHHRLDLNVFFNGYTETNIRKLAIDFEYTSFLLKNFTTFCLN